MSLESFNDRNIESQRGKYYVDGQCLDCDLCRETAPTIFTRQDEHGYSYIYKQPETPEEIEQVKESMEGCCTEAIHDDGDQYDWDMEVQPIDHNSLKEKPPSGTCCSHHSQAPEPKKSAFRAFRYRIKAWGHEE